jgi:uncharacterized protein YraI
MDTIKQQIIRFFSVLLALVLTHATAEAEVPAKLTTTVNLRTGPGTSFDTIGVVPAGDVVTVFTCNSGYSWCDINYIGARGYVSGRYLAYDVNGEYFGQPIITVGRHLSQCASLLELISHLSFAPTGL